MPDPPADGQRAAAPSLITDHRTDEYRKKFLELAIDAGKVFKDDPSPLDDAKIKSNYTLLETEITSWGAQLFDACKTHFLTVFTDPTRHGYGMKRCSNGK
mmetsp:Transcript_61726/g.127539  ORF Transcript_61726/g.127539 Transcript_61726/m.127539 type:complete len:100 (+) Transcript_61726:1080-1379(+)